jgi:hypothetical protein
MTGVARINRRKRRARSHRRAAEAPVRLGKPGVQANADYSWECLSRLARILVRCGHSPKALVIQLQRICATLREPSRQFDPRRLSFLADLPHVLALWHSDPNYLDERGGPAALPLQGPDPSLGSLIGRVLPHEDPRVVARTLLRMQGIRRRGTRYLPTGKLVPFRQDTVLMHSLSILMRMLRTIERNVAGSWDSALLERNTTHPNFPVSALPGFHRRLKRQASDFLWGLDGDMRRREKRVRGGKRTRLGVEIFAFEEPVSEGPPTALRNHGTRRKTRASSKARRARRSKP